MRRTYCVLARCSRASSAHGYFCRAGECQRSERFGVVEYSAESALFLRRGTQSFLMQANDGRTPTSGQRKVGTWPHCASQAEPRLSSRWSAGCFSRHCAFIMFPALQRYDRGQLCQCCLSVCEAAVRWHGSVADRIAWVRDRGGTSMLIPGSPWLLRCQVLGYHGYPCPRVVGKIPCKFPIPRVLPIGRESLLLPVH